eukprot:7670870-Pyramimonas_sp.AAC.1
MSASSVLTFEYSARPPGKPHSPSAAPMRPIRLLLKLGARAGPLAICACLVAEGCTWTNS